MISSHKIQRKIVAPQSWVVYSCAVLSPTPVLHRVLVFMLLYPMDKFVHTFSRKAKSDARKRKSYFCIQMGCKKCLLYMWHCEEAVFPPPGLPSNIFFNLLKKNHLRYGFTVILCHNERSLKLENVAPWACSSCLFQYSHWLGESHKSQINEPSFTLLRDELFSSTRSKCCSGEHYEFLIFTSCFPRGRYSKA